MSTPVGIKQNQVWSLFVMYSLYLVIECILQKEKIKKPENIEYVKICQQIGHHFCVIFNCFNLIYNITEQQNHLLLVFVRKIKTLKMSLSEIRLCSKKSAAIAASFTVPHIFFTSSD